MLNDIVLFVAVIHLFVSGHQRYHLGWYRDHHNISKTMERGTLSQVAQTESFIGEVAALNGGDTKLNHFALKSKLYLQDIHDRLCQTAGTQSCLLGCVR